VDINSEEEKKPVSIIQEIETQLESYLRRQHEEIEKKLEQRIQEERELARQQLTQIEEEVKQEWQALEEYGQLWEQFEEERNQILQKIRGYLNKIVERQQKIEELAKETSEDIRVINGLQDRLEEIRNQSMEKSGFLKRQLEEKFGLKAELVEKASAPAEDIDLTPEIEKLQKVKELLTFEQEIKGGTITPASQIENERPEAKSGDEPQAEIELKAPGQAEAQTETRAEAEPESGSWREPSLEEKLAEEIKKGLAEKMNNKKTAEGEKTAGQEAGESNTDRQELLTFYHQEPANGSGWIGYYQKNDHCVVEIQEILNRIKKTVEEAKKAYYKLNLVSSVKEQFFLKRELIAEQEGLKKYLQKVLWLAEKKRFTFPLLAQDFLNQAVIEDLVDLLRTQNWGAPEDLNHFEQKTMAIISGFDDRVNPPSVYYSILKKELEI